MPDTDAAARRLLKRGLRQEHPHEEPECPHCDGILDAFVVTPRFARADSTDAAALQAADVETIGAEGAPYTPEEQARAAVFDLVYEHHHPSGAPIRGLDARMNAYMREVEARVRHAESARIEALYVLAARWEQEAADRTSDLPVAAAIRLCALDLRDAVRAAQPPAAETGDAP